MREGGALSNIFLIFFFKLRMQRRQRSEESTQNLDFRTTVLKSTDSELEKRWKKLKRGGRRRVKDGAARWGGWRSVETPETEKLFTSHERASVTGPGQIGRAHV